jgi:hypothetical protein
MKNVVFWNIKNQFVPHRRQVTSPQQCPVFIVTAVTDYEECRLLGYKNPVRTSQETYYFSNRNFSRLMLCNISGFHGGDYEECRLLELDAGWLL